MKSTQLTIVAAISLILLTGCGSESTDGSSSPTALAFDPSAPLAPQMMAAIDANDADLADRVISAGYDLTSALLGDYPALHIAAARDAVDVVPVLLAAGADLEATVLRRTPLMFAAPSASSETVTILLEAGADTAASDPASNGVTAIHIAAQNGNVDVLDTLIAWGVDPDLRDSSNTTPLIWAAFTGQGDVVNYLLDLDVDINWRDDFGDTPFRAASRQGYDEIATIIAEHGGTA